MDDDTEFETNEIPQGTPDFENQFDYKPLKKGTFARIEESFFKIMRGKQKPVPQKPVQQKPVRPPVKMTGTAAKPLNQMQKQNPVQNPVQKQPIKTPGLAMEKWELGKPEDYIPKAAIPNIPLEEPLFVTADIENKPYPGVSSTKKGFLSFLKRKEKVTDEVQEKPETPIPKSKLSSINKLNVLINGIALLLFAAGAYILYSELPTRPELIAGIVLVSCASGVLAGRA